MIHCQRLLEIKLYAGLIYNNKCHRPADLSGQEGWRNLRFQGRTSL